MAEDVVEQAIAGVDVGDAGVAQVEVGQAQLGHHGLAVGDLAGREIHADELGAGQRDGHGQQVAAVGAAQLEHAAVVQAGRLEAQQRGQGGQRSGWVWLCERLR